MDTEKQKTVGLNYGKCFWDLISYVNQIRKGMGHRELNPDCFLKTNEGLLSQDTLHGYTS